MEQWWNDADHPLLPNAEVKKEWSYASTPYGLNFTSLLLRIS
jgi:hypothetical protein